MELNINISQNQSVHEKIKKIIGLTNLDALYLTEKEIENIFEFTMLIDSWVLGFERNDGSQVILHKTEKRKTVFGIFVNNQLFQKIVNGKSAQ